MVHGLEILQKHPLHLYPCDVVKVQLPAYIHLPSHVYPMLDPNWKGASSALGLTITPQVCNLGALMMWIDLRELLLLNSWTFCVAIFPSFQFSGPPCDCEIVSNILSLLTLSSRASCLCTFLVFKGCVLQCVQELYIPYIYWDIYDIYTSEQLYCEHLYSPVID